VLVTRESTAAADIAVIRRFIELSSVSL